MSYPDEFVEQSQRRKKKKKRKNVKRERISSNANESGDKSIQDPHVSVGGQTALGHHVITLHDGFSSNEIEFHEDGSSGEDKDHMIESLQEELDVKKFEIDELYTVINKLQGKSSKKKNKKGHGNGSPALRSSSGKKLQKRSSHNNKEGRRNVSQNIQVESDDEFEEVKVQEPPVKSPFARSPSHLEMWIKEGEIEYLPLEKNTNLDTSPISLHQSSSSIPMLEHRNNNFSSTHASYVEGASILSNANSNSFSIPYSFCSDIHATDAKGYSQLHWACIYGDIQAVNCLLDNGADINMRDYQNNTPLLLAIQHLHPEVTSLLIARGADVTGKDSKDNTPLHLCLGLGESFNDLTHTLISYNAGINTQNINGNSPLMLACANRNVAAAKALIHKGADVNTKNKYFDTPLLWACQAGEYELASWLISTGADLTARDTTGCSPLHKAANAGHKDIVELLVEAGADLRLKNDKGHTPLDESATPQIRKLLEDHDPGTKSWKWEMDYNELVIDEVPKGEGHFSVCYRAMLHGTPVAVKKLKYKLNSAGMQSFNHEVGLMSDIKSPNVVLFLGACIQDPHLCIVTEYLPRGSLRDYMKYNTLSWSQVLVCAITTARGMAWLHSRKPVVLHRDLHSNNILVTDSGECKVADFGLSQIQGQRCQSRTLYRRIIPPEVLKGELFTKKSDVFMYGLVLCELFTGKKVDMNTVKQINNLHNEPHFPNQPARDDFISLIKSCCSHVCEDRPQFEPMLMMLDAIQHKQTTQVREKILNQQVTTTHQITGEYI